MGGVVAVAPGARPPTLAGRSAHAVAVAPPATTTATAMTSRLPKCGHDRSAPRLPGGLYWTGGDRVGAGRFRRLPAGSRSTFYAQAGQAEGSAVHPAIQGALRVVPDEFERWLSALENRAGDRHQLRHADLGVTCLQGTARHDSLHALDTNGRDGSSQSNEMRSSNPAAIGLPPIPAPEGVRPQGPLD